MIYYNIKEIKLKYLKDSQYKKHYVIYSKINKKKIKMKNYSNNKLKVNIKILIIIKIIIIIILIIIKYNQEIYKLINTNRKTILRNNIN